jgi:hypothetical protein
MNGKQITELEKQMYQVKAAGWKPPTPFSVKAADGKMISMVLCLRRLILMQIENILLLIISSVRRAAVLAGALVQQR